jgi:hypothetical protein
MIVSMQLPSGRTVHVCPDNEPVFSAHEVMLMCKGDFTPEAAEFTARIKATFPGTKLTNVEPLPDGPELKGDTQMAFLGFNVDEAPDTQDFTVMPAGDYTALITASELVSNKAGTGSFLKLELTITDGKFAGRKLFENLNLDNPSAQAVEIARGTLKKIAIACGKASGVVNESEELHDIPMIINVGIEKRKDTGEDSNRIKGYKSLTAAPAARTPAPAARPQSAAATPPRPAAGGAAPAWAR